MSKSRHNTLLIELLSHRLGPHGWVRKWGLWVRSTGELHQIIALQKWTTGSDNYNMILGSVVGGPSFRGPVRTTKLDVTWDVLRILAAAFPDDVDARRTVLDGWDMTKNMDPKARESLIEMFVRVVVLPLFDPAKSVNSLRDICKDVKHPMHTFIEFVGHPELRKMELLAWKEAGWLADKNKS